MLQASQQTNYQPNNLDPQHVSEPSAERATGSRRDPYTSSSRRGHGALRGNHSCSSNTGERLCQQLAAWGAVLQLLHQAVEHACVHGVGLSNPAAAAVGAWAQLLVGAVQARRCCAGYQVIASPL